MGTAKPPVDVPVRIALAAFYAALRYDGILILDQRNYDEMLYHDFMFNHEYYYCGDQVTAEPEYLDERLDRVKYSFPDGCEYTLNMFPLRKGYARRLIREAGFDRVRTYGDFQKNYQDYQPDFFIHVVEKSMRANDWLGGHAADVASPGPTRACLMRRAR
jgi:glycine/sarcosine/dimethylglycine N-methyltransferase